MHFSIVFTEFTTPFGASRGPTVLLDQCLHRFSDPPRKFRFRFVSLGILQVFSRVNRLTDNIAHLAGQREVNRHVLTLNRYDARLLRRATTDSHTRGRENNGPLYSIYFW